jgi:hypothetical protein
MLLASRKKLETKAHIPALSTPLRIPPKWPARVMSTNVPVLVMALAVPLALREFASRGYRGLNDRLTNNQTWQMS